MLKREEKLFESLTEEQQVQFEKIEELRNEQIGEENKGTFIYAFSLGVKLLLESLDKI